MSGTENTMIGRTFGGRYEMRSQISDSPRSEIWLAKDTQTGNSVAFKIHKSDAKQTETELAQFKRVVIATTNLRHEHLVRTLNAGIDVDQHGHAFSYIVLEYVDAPTLRQVLDTETLTIAQAIQIAAQVAEALDCAHSAGLIHNDVKPQNILVGQKGQEYWAKLTDFGAASFASSPEPSRAGTAKYASPERLRGFPSDTRSDLYSLGVVLYEMLAEHPPIDGETERDIAMAQVNETPKPIADVRSDMPDAISQIVERLLTKTPSDRFSSAIAVRNALLYNQTDSPQVEEKNPTPKQGIPKVESQFQKPTREPMSYATKRTLAIFGFAAFLAVLAVIIAVVSTL